MADSRGKGREAGVEVRSIERLRARVEALVRAGAALSTRDLALKGDDLMATLGLAPGRQVGVILQHLVEVVTDDPEANTREALLDAARAFIAQGQAAG